MPLNKAVVIEGDGIGPEIVRAAVDVINATGLSIDWEIQIAGLISLEKHGTVITQTALDSIRRCGVALKGPFSTPSGGNQRSANWYIRRELDLYANVRTLNAPERNINIIIVRENTEDLYGAIEWMATKDVAQAVKVTSRFGCERIARFAMDLAIRQNRHRVTIIHKANNLKMTDGMFLQIAMEVGKLYPQIEVDDMLVDSAGAALISMPEKFDIMLMPNTYGDILSSVGAAVINGIGLVPSMNYGTGIAVAEAAHGSAPALAGTHQANPLAIISAGAMMIDWMGYPLEAKAILNAILQIRMTPYSCGKYPTKEITSEIVRSVKKNLFGG